MSWSLSPPFLRLPFFSRALPGAPQPALAVEHLVLARQLARVQRRVTQMIDQHAHELRDLRHELQQARQEARQQHARAEQALADLARLSGQVSAGQGNGRPP